MSSKRMRLLFDEEGSGITVLELLHQLLEEFKRVQNHVVQTAHGLNIQAFKALSQQSTAAINNHNHTSSIPQHNFNPSPVPPQTAASYLEEHQGCSWSQFVVTMALFFAKQCDRIAALAFGIGKDPGEKSPLADIQKVTRVKARARLCIYLQCIFLCCLAWHGMAWHGTALPLIYVFSCLLSSLPYSI